MYCWRVVEGVAGAGLTFVWDGSVRVEVTEGGRSVMSRKSRKGGFKHERPGDNFTIKIRQPCRKVHL